MDPLSANPFAVLTFIAAPAILTNASSVMALGTSNRFARAVDRARAVARELEAQPPPPEPIFRLRTNQLRYGTRRVLLLVRALTAFYASLGAFAAASLASLLGAVLVITHHDTGRDAAMLIAFGCGLLGIGGLVGGASVLVLESRLTLAILREESALLARDLPREPR